MAVEIKIAIKNLPQIRAAFAKAPALMNKNLNIAIKQTVFFVRGEAQKNAPVRTGFLRGSAYTAFAPLRGETGFRARYAAVVHEGSKAHIIEARNKKALYWRGAAHPMRRVRHPGTRANPFLRRAVESSQPQIDKFFEKAVNDTLSQVAKESS